MKKSKFGSVESQIHLQDELSEKDRYTLLLYSQKMRDQKHTLEFIYNRLVNVYHEREAYDYMRALKSVIDSLP